MSWGISDFHEVRELGRGTQGRVVLARHVTGGPPVAIKYLPPGADPAAREVFRNEARMLARVRHPNVARLHRLFEDGDGAALVMEVVDGVSLKRVLAEAGALGPEASLLLLKGSLLGLAAAHAHQVVHRDYKPANVIVRADGVSKLIDFGVAARTGDGGRVGTPAYMAPEQWRGEPATPATDVYAAACVFYECVTGHRPYTARTGPDLMAAHVRGPVPTRDVPAALRRLVARGLAKSPGDRPPGAAAFAAELEDAAARAYGPGWEERAVRAVALAAAALAPAFPLAAAAVPLPSPEGPADGPDAAEAMAEGPAIPDGVEPDTVVTMAGDAAESAGDAARDTVATSGEGTSATAKAVLTASAAAITAAVVAAVVFGTADRDGTVHRVAASPSVSTHATTTTTSPTPSHTPPSPSPSHASPTPTHTSPTPSPGTPSPGTPSPRFPEYEVPFGPHGYGEVELGMTEAELEATGRARLRPNAAVGDCRVYDVTTGPRTSSATARLLPGSGVIAIFGRDGVRTPEDIGVGSTLAELRAAYPSTKRFPSAWITPVPGNPDASYTSQVVDGRIAEFVLRLRDTGCFNVD